MTETIERTRLDALREKEAEVAAEVDTVRNRLEGYPAAQATEREHSWYSNQKNHPLSKLNTPLQKLIDAEKKDVATLNGLNQDLSAIRNVIAQEDGRVREQETAEARAQLEQLHRQEEDVWTKAGELLESMATVWNSYVAQVEQSHQFASANGLESSDALAVIPGPSSFREFFDLLLTAATSDEVRSEPHTEQLVDSGIYGRRDENGNDIGGATYDTRIVGMRTLETRRRLDERDVLYYVVPDLRSVVFRRLSLSGRAPKFTAEWSAREP
jgi:hypothetical protein